MKKWRELFALSLLMLLLFLGAYKEVRTTPVFAYKTYFQANVLEVGENFLLVEPLEGMQERMSADLISVSTADIGEEKSVEALEQIEVGDVVEIGYLGEIAESYPAQINSAFEITVVSEEE